MKPFSRIILLPLLVLGAWASQAWANVSGVSVTLGTTTVNTASQYTVGFTTGASGALATTDTIRISFPNNTTVPSSLTAAQITVNGTAATTISVSSQLLTITSPVAVANSTAVSVVISTASNSIVNPSVPGNYQVNVNTSVETTNVASSNYTVAASSTAVTVGSVTVNPATIGNYGAYSFTLTLGAAGALWAGNSQIVVTLPTGTTVTNGSISGVTVGGSTATSATGNSSGRTITIVPALNFANNASATVAIPSSAVRNPTATGTTYTLTCSTSAQPAGTSPAYSITTSGTAVSVGTVTASPATISNYSQYTINFSTGSDGALVGGTSTITVTFPSGYTVANGSISGVTVGGTTASSATGSSASRTITITPAQDIAASASNVAIVIPSSGSAVLNPATAGNYQLTVATSVQTSSGSSGSVAIGQSSTSVSISGVTPSPATAGNSAQYTINFTTSSDGALVSGSTITIVFPSGTSVKNGSMSNVTVNGTTATTTGNSSTRTVTITTPSAIATSTAVAVVIGNSGSNLQNPTTSGNHNLTVATTVQPAGTSPNYTIGLSSTVVSVTSVTPAPTVVGNDAAYTIVFATSSDGAISSGGSIVLTFPSGTSVPAGSLSNITVNGTAATSATGVSASRTITIVPSAAIAVSTTVTVVVQASVGVRNPTTAGSYTLTVSTSAQPAGTSPSYAIGQSSTTVTVGSATPSPAVVGNPSQYSINFNTSSDGALVGGTSTITVTFPSDTLVTNGSLSGVTVEGTAATSATGNTSAYTITIVPAQNIAASTSNVTISIPTSALRNPTSAGSYTLTVATSAQPVGTSPSYTISKSSTAVNVGSVSVSPNTIGNQGAYTINFTTSSDGPLIANASTITITFPSGSVVTNGAISGVTVEGTNAASAIGNSTSRTITITPAATISGGTSNVTIVTPVSAVRNPTTSGSYTLTVVTSAQPVGTSSSYTIGQSSTSVAISSVTASPNTIGNQGAYTIDFATSSDGALVGTVSTITVTLPSDTVVTNGSISGVTVEGTAATSATGNSSGRTITITPAQSISGGTSAITLSIPSSAVRNPTTSGSYTLTVATSVQPAGTSPSYTIGQSSTSVNVTAVTPNPTTSGNWATYTINFTTASDAALLSGSTITIVFPSGTSVRNGSISNVTVNGTTASSTNGNSTTRTVTITLASAISASTAVTVVIPSSANNVRNPSSGNYQLTVATTVQPAGTSPLYAIGLSSNTVTVTSATPSSAVVGNTTSYTIVFTTSSDGQIPSSTGNIVVQFPTDTLVPDGTIAGVTVGGATATSATGSSLGRTVTIVPSADVTASTSVTVVIPGIRNPTSTGSFTLTVATSAQPSGTSPSYSITQSATALSVTSVTPSPATVGSDSAYAIAFTTSADGPLFSGISQIVVTFPSDTYVVNGTISGVTVGGTAVTSATGNSTSRTITLVVGGNIAVSTASTISIPSSALHNPSTAGNYTLTVATTAQPAGSRQYAITLGSALAVDSVALSTYVVNTNALYTVNITPSVVLRANTSSIFLVFPNSTSVPSGAISGVTVDSNGAYSATGDSTNRVVTVVPAFDVTAGSSIAVAFTSAVIMNSSIPGGLAISASTTAQPMGSSASFTITASTSTLTTPSVTASPSQAGVAAQYTINFSVGSRGRLVEGNTISITFPTGTILPSPLPAGTITINGVGTTTAVTPSGTSITVPVPAGVSIANSGSVAMVLSGINNPNLGAKQLQMNTDAEPTVVNSVPFYITANTHISTPAVTVTPATIYATAAYTVTFTLGASGSLAANADSIYIVFPTATTLPTTLTPAQITVRNAGTSGVVTSVSRLSASALAIVSPIDVLSGASDKTVIVEIQSGFGLQNPSLAGSYTLAAYTSIENTSETSSSYTISPSTSTQISTPQVDMFPGFINSYARYQISFSVGSLGALAANVSTVSITFPAGFTLPASINATSILVNNTALAAAPTVSGQTLTLTVPVAVSLSGAVTLVIQATAHIQNPSVTGTYSLTLATSSEPNLVSSNSFEIRRSTWADVVGYPNPLKYDTSVNKAFIFTLIPDHTATLKLYSLDGRLVKTITKDDDTDRMVWNLDNEKGNLVASGIYIYIIKGESGEKRGKIGFLK